MNARNPVLFREFRHPFHDLAVGFDCRIILASRDLIGLRTQRAFRRPVTGQSSGGKQMYGITPIFSSRQSGSISRSSSR